MSICMPENQSDTNAIVYDCSKLMPKNRFVNLFGHKEDKVKSHRHESSKISEDYVNCVLRKAISLRNPDGGAKYFKERPNKKCSVAKGASHSNLCAVRWR